MKFVYESASGTYVVPARYVCEFVADNGQHYEVFVTHDIIGRPTIRLVSGKAPGVVYGDEMGGLVRIQQPDEDVT